MKELPNEMVSNILSYLLPYRYNRVCKQWQALSVDNALLYVNDFQEKHSTYHLYSSQTQASNAVYKYKECLKFLGIKGDMTSLKKLYRICERGIACCYSRKAAISYIEKGKFGNSEQEVEQIKQLIKQRGMELPDDEEDDLTQERTGFDYLLAHFNL